MEVGLTFEERVLDELLVDEDVVCLTGLLDSKWVLGLGRIVGDEVVPLLAEQDVVGP